MMNTHATARVSTSSGEALALQGVRLEGTLDGALFEATVIQRFQNPHDEHVEVVYTFPLPWAAILLGVQVQLGERHLRGIVVEKRQAEAEYEGALADGNTAIKLERNSDGSFTLNLGNLTPQEQCTIRLRYSQVLPFEQRNLRLLIPTVIAPRFGDPQIDGRLQPHQTVEHDFAVEYPFELSLRLVGELARARVASPSHPISVKWVPDANAIEISLAKAGRLDRDFVLVVSECAQDSLAISGQDPVDASATTTLASFCPLITQRRPVAVKILVDCSGSMHGDSIGAARRALQAIIGQFEAGDRFSLSRFGDRVEHRSRGLWRTTETTRLAAQRWANNLEADLGGTEMEAALLSTFDLARGLEEDVPVDVLLITDGEISAIDRTLESAEASGHRVFVVGAGSSPAEGLLRRMGEVTGGTSDFVAPGEAVEPAVLRMFARLRSPRLNNLQIQWPEGTSPLWASAAPKFVFDGDNVSVFAGFASAPHGTVRLLARETPEAPPEVIAEAALGPIQISDALARMGAAARVGSLAKDQRPASQTEAVRLAVAYQLVTTRTNFLLVDERAAADKPDDMPRLAKVPSMLPAGWGGMGSVLAAEAMVCRSPVAPPASDVPAVMRCARRLSSGVTDDALAGAYDIPAFLRRDRAGKRSAVPAKSNPQHWSRSEHYSGLTPLGLCEWLRAGPEALWPKTYEDLRDIGLGTAVVDWLELTFGQDAEESVLVRAFLMLMALPDTHAALIKSLSPLAQVKEHAKRLTSRARNTLSLDAPLQNPYAARLAPLLADLQAETWPTCVFALETVI